jgi:ABC-type phosphate transport system substrate-binding protein
MKHLLLFALLLVPSLRAAEAVEFIAHPAAGVEQLSRSEVEAILLNKKARWDNGQTIFVVIAPSAPLHAQVVQDFTQRSADQFEKFCKRLVFTGKGAFPKTVASEADVLSVVASTPGAFGYVVAGSATGAVKVVKVE